MKSLLLLSLLLQAAPQKPSATFALIIGLNDSPDPSLAPLRYADDDAARYQELFRTLGARTYLLTRLDAASKRLNPQAAAESREPTLRELELSVREASEDIRRAQQRGVETDFYFVYAGHGTVEDGRGAITMADGRLDGDALSKQIAAQIPATRIHFIVDACYSYFLAYGRGPGGERREFRGFSELPLLLKDNRVGLLLSTSSARESHEWEGFQSGVFSHEVRSGLYGAADSDGDGQVSYREISAFIARANQPILNERFRSEVHARAPRGQGDRLIDLKLDERPYVQVDGALGAHYLLEDRRGVRLADFHNSRAQQLRMLRPGTGSLFLRRVSDGFEYVLPPGAEPLVLAQLQGRPSEVGERGAAHQAFSQLFDFPFDKKVVSQFDAPLLDSPLEVKAEAAQLSTRRKVGLGVLGAGVAAGVAGGIMTSTAFAQRNEALAATTQVEAAAGVRKAQTSAIVAIGLYGAAGAAIVTGALLALIPDAKDSGPQLTAGPTPGGGQLSLSGRF